jgi:hypothetical protein
MRQSHLPSTGALRFRLQTRVTPRCAGSAFLPRTSLSRLPILDEREGAMVRSAVAADHGEADHEADDVRPQVQQRLKQLVLAAGLSQRGTPILMRSSVIEIAKTPALMVRTRTNSSVPRAHVPRRPVAAHPLRAGVAASGGLATAIAIMVSLPRPVQAIAARGKAALTGRRARE